MMTLRIAFVAIFLSSFFISFSQDLIINYDEPSVLIVCDTNDFSFTITNASPDTIFGTLVTINTPTGIEYISGSISSGVESNITIPNAPEFSYPTILPFESISFSISTRLKCDLVGSINDGLLFTNTISAIWNGGNNAVTTNPYLIETPLLVIIDISDSPVAGNINDTIIRVITIQNTRLGTLTNFTFSDTHNGGITISTDLGTVINSTSNLFEVQFGPNDFMTLGDGDGIFEQDEILVITEEVIITDCGIDVPFTNSTYSISWGCFNEICQEEDRTALIDIVQLVEEYELEIDAYSILPVDHCAGLAAEQSAVIKNIGSEDAIGVTIKIDLAFGGLPGASAAVIDPNSFVQDSSGVITNVIPIGSDPSFITDCTFPPGTFSEATLFYDKIAAGDSIILTWDYYYCRLDEFCETPQPPLTIEYEVNTICPSEFNMGISGASSANIRRNFELIMEDSVFYSIGVPYLDEAAHNINYGLRSEKLLGSGILQLEITLPCELSWEVNDLEMGGVFPFDINVNMVDMETIVTAHYNLPFDDEEIFTNFDLGFVCDLTCDPELGICEEPYLTINGDFDCGTLSLVTIESSLQEDPNVSFDCSMKACSDALLVVDCELGMPLDSFVFVHDFERFNFDFPDNDDDRIPDSSGQINPNLIRKDRAIPGDTVLNIVRGTFLHGVDVDLMTVQFEAHAIDQGLDGGVRLDVGKNLDLMVDGGILPLTATIRIVDASTGDIFECEIGDPIEIRDTLMESFTIVNTEPPNLLDRMLYEQFKYNTTLADIPCVPAGFQYETGDSLIFITLHKMIYNPLSQREIGVLDSIPPVLNLRSAVVPIRCDEFNPYVTLEESFHSHFQYSGYAYQVHLDQYDAETCINFNSIDGTLVRFVLGMDNFFPFEYRPLAALTSWNISFPTGVILLDAQLERLRYQDGNDIITNQIIPFTANGQLIDFEVSSFHEPVLDEGWEMLFQFEFDNVCTVNDFASMVTEMTLDLNPCLPESSDAFYTRGGNVFETGAPVLNAAVTSSCFEGFDDDIFYDLVLLNSGVNVTKDAENAWIQPVSLSGLVSNFELINTNTGQTFSAINGIFQLGTVSIDQLQNYRLTAVNNSCVEEIIELNYGWNCNPFTSPADEVCISKTLFLKAISPNGELEMDVVSPVGPFSLCEVIDYHTIEIFNAQLGNVFDIVLEMTLPLGLEIVPNSSQMAYPTGSTFIDIVEPTNVAGNIFQWDIPTLDSLIQEEGLLGVSQDPGNSVSIRFQTTTDCGFIAGSQIVFNVIGQQNCNIPTNNLSKTGDPLEISGINPAYNTDINVSISTTVPITCGVDIPLNINILPDGATTVGDTVLINLPLGTSFVPGTYIPLNNAPTDPPIIFNNSGQEILKLKLEQGVAPNTLISFEITVTGFGLNGCNDQLIQVQTVQQQDAVCTTTGELCYVLAETGSTTVSIAAEFPELFIDDFSLVEFNGDNYLSTTVGNNGIENSSNIRIDFYIDEDGDGMLSPGDILVDSLLWSATIATGETLSESFLTNITPDLFCKLMVVIDEEKNCLCTTSAMSLNGPLISNQTELICSGEITQIGVPSTNGHIYQWESSPNISSVNTAMTDFQFSNTTGDTVFFDLVLSDINENGCEVVNNVTVGVLPFLQINQQDIEGCAGDDIVLSATNGAIYNWEGPGITNPALQTQVVTLFENATYTITISNSVGCENMDQINVNISPLLESNSSFEKCPEESVDIFGELISSPGMYCDTMSNVQGCDSVICIDLTDFISNTNAIIGLCPNDSVEINGVFYKEPQEVCNDFISSFGCDSTHCVTIESRDEPFAKFVGIGVNGEIIFEEGVETQIEVTEGFMTYEWSPAAGLSCTDCYNPLATLTENTEFQVTVTDDDGCSTIITLIARVYPRCNPERIEIPNAFTPDGDGVNDLFGVEFEGFEMIASIKIFDRWGEKVYENSGENAFWDGTIDGKPGTSDVYVYIIKLTCEEGEGTRVGDVTLIR